MWQKGAPHDPVGARRFAAVQDPLAKRASDLPAPLPPRGTKEAALECAGRWAGSSEELDQLLAEVERMRERDLSDQGSSSA
jgi:hypothetical protein